jgi:two-component system sensor histidine kinase GlrK
MRLSIFRRLVIGYVLILLLVAAANIYAIDQLRRFNDVTRSMLTVDNRLLDIHKRLSDALLAEMRAEKKLVLMRDYGLEEQVQAAQDRFTTNVQEALSIADTEQLVEVVTRIGKDHLQYEGLVNQEVTWLKEDRSYNRELYTAQKERTGNRLIEDLKGLRDDIRLRTYAKIQGLDFSVTRGRSIALGIIGATLLIGIIVSIIMTRTITKPLSALKRKTQELAGGHLGGTVTVSSPPEITELADAFNVMSTKLKEVDKIKSDFLSLMSHELRTPLTSIKEGTNLLLEGVGGKVTEKQKRLLSIIAEEDRRLLDLVNALLDLSKMEAGMMGYSFSQGDVRKVITRTLREVEPLAQAKRIQLEQDIADNLPDVSMDAERIRQAVRNLLSNAVKFTPKTGTIRIRTRVNKGAVEVSVKDTGPGIPEEDLARVFDKYQQARNNHPGRRKGTGLGLAIVKHIIDAHGGRTWAESEPGGGSTFTFALPLS